MTMEPASNEPAGSEQLPDQLHQILQEWSQLILSLASLIRENVEGLLPAVFNLASLASRASEARVEATGGARQAGASLRDRAAELSAAMKPLADVARHRDELHATLAELQTQAQGFRASANAVPGLDDFLDRLAGGPQAVLPQMQSLIDGSAAVETRGSEALQQLTSGLDVIDSLLHADTA